MSKANGATLKQDTYLQHVSLKNYKSIKDAEIDFKPGLNIIIGKNASGKTNFINGLNAVLGFNYDELLDSEILIKAAFKGNELQIRALSKSQSSEDLSKKDYYDPSVNHEMSLKVNSKDITVSDYEEVRSELLDNDWYFSGVLIKYGTYYKETTQFINIPFSFTVINNGKISRELMTVNKEDGRTYFLSTFFHRLYINIVRNFEIKPINRNQDLKEQIIDFAKLRLAKINDVVSKYTAIQSVRLNPDFNIIKEEGDQKQTITNFYLEFLIDQNWLSFGLLSDGTKRLFYIISEMLASYYDPDTIIYHTDLEIILLEEPELGIHPHQLHKLMQFIKEQSREKQIILTTHSPQVLDILESDELDRVIICHYDPQKGTQLSHLSDKEVKKAKKYMQEEAFLSDYWRFSDLEPAS